MNTYLLLMPSGYEVVVILLVVVLLFGGKKIPELMRGLGKGMSEFKKASSGMDDIKKEIGKTATDLDKQSPIDKTEKKDDDGQKTDENKSDK
jgi:sec-independent protein translocase protein TatA